MRRPVLHAPDPRLHDVAQAVETFDDALAQLVADMADTMYAEGGIGLAATQLGVAQRVILVDLSANRASRKGLCVFVNPVLSKGKGLSSIDEGCLSVPGQTARPRRFARIELRAQDAQGRPVRLKTDGLLAVCLQHEVDHLDGVLMTDRARAPLA